MVPEDACLGVALINLINPPMLMMNQAISQGYGDTARIWIDIVNQLVMTDPKYKENVSGAGHLTNMACDGTAQKMIKPAEKKQLLKLKGSPEETSRELLDGSIIDIILRKSPIDDVGAEMDVLSEIIDCLLKRYEKPSE